MVTAQVATELSSLQGETTLAPSRHEMGTLRLSVRIHDGFGKFGPRIDMSSYKIFCIVSLTCGWNRA